MVDYGAAKMMRDSVSAEAEDCRGAARQLRGTVKWFDPTRGFGFVETEDDAEGDILFSAQTLETLGLETATEGSTVVCEAVMRAKGLQAVRILSLDPSTASPRGVHAPAGPFRQVRVKWFSRVKGYGFLTEGEGTPDIFVHVEVVRAAGMGELQPGDTLEVSSGEGPKGSLAVAVRPVKGN